MNIKANELRATSVRNDEIELDIVSQLVMEQLDKIKGENMYDCANFRTNKRSDSPLYLCWDNAYKLATECVKQGYFVYTTKDISGTIFIFHVYKIDPHKKNPWLG